MATKNKKNYTSIVDICFGSAQARCSSTTSRHVSFFVSNVLKASCSVPSKKTLESLTNGEVLYTYPDTNYKEETGTIDELRFAYGP